VNIFITSHFIVMTMCLIVYLLYGVLGKAEITPFQFLIILGIAIVPVLNVVFTFWCIVYLVYSLFCNMKTSILSINKKAFYK
jgi:hypothetical protein